MPIVNLTLAHPTGIRIGACVGHYRLVLGIIDSRRVLLASVGGLRWVRKAFYIPTYWYRQHEGVCVEGEYRLLAGYGPNN